MDLPARRRLGHFDLGALLDQRTVLSVFEKRNLAPFDLVQFRTEDSVREIGRFFRLPLLLLLGRVQRQGVRNFQTGLKFLEVRVLGEEVQVALVFGLLPL